MQQKMSRKVLDVIRALRFGRHVIRRHDYDGTYARYTPNGQVVPIDAGLLSDLRPFLQEEGDTLTLNESALPKPARRRGGQPGARKAEDQRRVGQTVSLPAELMTRLREEAKRQGVTFSSVVSRACEKSLGDG